MGKKGEDHYTRQSGIERAGGGEGGNAPIKTLYTKEIGENKIPKKGF